MKLAIFQVYFFLFSLTLFAQPTAEFEWAIKGDRTIEGQENPNLVFPKESGFTVYSVEEIGTHIYAPKVIFVSKFSANGKSQSKIDFKLPQRSNKDATLLQVIEGKDKLYFISHIAVKKDGKNILYAHIYDNNSHTVSEVRELYTIPIEKVNNSGFFEVQISEDKSKLGVLVHLPFEKKTKESIVLLEFDEELNQVSNNKLNLSFESERAYNESFFYHNDGTTTIIKKTDTTKKNPITTLITIEGNLLNEKQISAEGFYISDHKVIVIEGTKYLMGYATDNAKPAASVGGAKDNFYFIYNISESKLVSNQEWSKATKKKFLGKGYIDLKVKDILVNENEIYLIGECFNKLSEPIEGKNFEYNYKHRFGPGIIVKMTIDGNSIYETPLNYVDEYLNDMDAVGSFYPFLTNGELFILMNEKESILKDKKVVFGYDKINAKGLVLRAFDSQGQITQTVFWNSKTGSTKDYTILGPAKTLRLSENSFYVYAAGNGFQKFGKMTIK